MPVATYLGAGMVACPPPRTPLGGARTELGDAGALALCQRGGGDTWVMGGSGGTGTGASSHVAAEDEGRQWPGSILPHLGRAMRPPPG